MPRFLSIAGLVLMMTQYSFAQSGADAAQCEQIRQAVDQYGYAAARQHAMANYGPQAVAAGERCLTGRDRMKGTSPGPGRRKHT
jgi:hypothetical protein